jgi:hypothetical protein
MTAIINEFSTLPSFIESIAKRSTKYSYKLVDGYIAYKFRIGYSNLNINVSQGSPCSDKFDFNISNIYVQTYLSAEDRDLGINVIDSDSISFNGESISYRLEVISDLIDRLSLVIHREAYTKEFKVHTIDTYMRLFGNLSEDELVNNLQLTYVDLCNLKVKPLKKKHIRKLKSKYRLCVAIEYKENVNC